jgi:biotin carboxyl carrier protein
MTKRVEVLSEITGSVWKLVAAAGQRVEAGDVLVIVESMKMEIPIEAPCAGTLMELACAEGQPIQEGATAGFIEVD